MNNIDVAIMTKLNDLAERRGLKPYDFVAVCKIKGPNDLETVLEFEMPASGNALREKRFDKMLSDLGIVGDSMTLEGEENIIDALDNAIRLSPRKRTL